MNDDEDKDEPLEALEQNVKETEEQRVDDEKYARFKLYASCALSFWGDRMWFFAVGLCFHYMNPKNFLLAAIYGLSNRLSIIIFCGPIGRWIDRSPRFKAASIFLTVQNGAVVVCTVCLIFILITKDIILEQNHGIFLLFGQCLVVLFASIGGVASVASSISVQRDWVRVIAGENKELLATMNTTIRCIDLTSSILGPIAVGYLMVISPIFGAIFLAGWNLISVVLEYCLLANVYREIPRLSVKPNLDLVEESKKSIHSKIAEMLQKHYGGWKVYWNQEILLAGLGFSYLYMTVLVFDSITIAYSTSQGVAENIMGILLAAGGMCGILATVAYPHFRKWFGMECTGFLGFTFELICLCLCVLSVWLPGSPFEPFSVWYTPIAKTPRPENVSNNFFGFSFEEYLFKEGSMEYVTIMKVNRTEYQGTPSSYLSISYLLTGIILSRFGLWMADLSVHQEIQELVDGRLLGAVCGIQSSLNQTFSLLKFILVAVIRWKETFGILVILSFMFVFFGWLSYSIFAKRRVAVLERTEEYRLQSTNET